VGRRMGLVVGRLRSGSQRQTCLGDDGFIGDGLTILAVEKLAIGVEVDTLTVCKGNGILTSCVQRLNRRFLFELRPLIRQTHGLHGVFDLVREFFDRLARRLGNQEKIGGLVVVILLASFLSLGFLFLA